MIPERPSPEWAINCLDRILTTDDPDVLEAVLELLAGLVPTETENKYKYDAACAAIDYGYSKTEHCRRSGRQYLGLAVKSVGIIVLLSFHLASLA